MKRACLFIAAGLVAGCGYSVSKTVSWSEEVDIGTGQIIVVDRKTVISASDMDPAKDTGKTSVVSFKDELANAPTWEEPLIPLLLYRDPDNAEWTLVAAGSGCGPSAYREFRWRGGAWRQVELSASSIGRDSNLYLDGYGDMPKATISTAAKKEARLRAGIPETYRTIARDASHCS